MKSQKQLKEELVKIITNKTNTVIDYVETWKEGKCALEILIQGRKIRDKTWKK